jgi:hypothetical protein
VLERINSEEVSVPIMSSEMPIISLLVRIFDRTSPDPLPPRNKTLFLESESLPDDMKLQFLQDLARYNARSENRIKPRGFSETIITQSSGPRADNQWIMKYRPWFVSDSDDNPNVLFEHPSLMLSAPSEYVEDETGLPTTMYEIIKHVSGNEAPIIMGDAGSVLALGPVEPQNTEDWTQEKANCIAQYLDVIRQIYNSTWYRSPLEITTSTENKDLKEILEAVFPPSEATSAVLAFIRQLHASDKLFEKACDIYMNHCSDIRKVHWIQFEKDRFIKMLESSPPLSFCQFKCKEIIRMFMYGAGLLHSSSNHGEEAKLEQFLTTFGREQAVFSFNSALMNVYTYSVRSFHVIKQDFEHWIEVHGFLPPDRRNIKMLFEGIRSSRSTQSDLGL